MRYYYYCNCNSLVKWSMVFVDKNKDSKINVPRRGETGDKFPICRIFNLLLLPFFFYCRCALFPALNRGIFCLQLLNNVHLQFV